MSVIFFFHKGADSLICFQQTIRRLRTKQIPNISLSELIPWLSCLFHTGVDHDNFSILSTLFATNGSLPFYRHSISKILCTLQNARYGNYLSCWDYQRIDKLLLYHRHGIFSRRVYDFSTNIQIFLLLMSSFIDIEATYPDLLICKLSHLSLRKIFGVCDAANDYALKV